MKEMFAGFLIALVVGSLWNQFQGLDSGVASAASGTPGGTGGGGMQNPIGNAALNPQGQLGQELVVDIDEGSFQGYVLDSREPVLIEFYTDNCPHCVKMAPVLGQLAYNGQGVFRICKINAAKSTALAERYEIKGVPAFALFVDGHKMDSTSGARSFTEMRSWLSQNQITVPDSPTSM
ncbi:MAG: thioredoxin family protein [Candidatus Melainabacteria bacterium]|nr:thioredoxin family protein [Candidatus Melainabacteria bacterium]